LRVAKNILDLKYNRYLQYSNTLMIIAYTYVIAAVFALLTGQIDSSSYLQMIYFGLISLFLLSAVMGLYFSCDSRMRDILFEIKSLGNKKHCQQ